MQILRYFRTNKCNDNEVTNYHDTYVSVKDMMFSCHRIHNCTWTFHHLKMTNNVFDRQKMTVTYT
jgi:hypothetical protein